jgi:hypothetical protein
MLVTIPTGLHKAETLINPHLQEKIEKQPQKWCHEATEIFDAVVKKYSGI